MIDQALRIKLVSIAQRQIRAGVDFKKPRLKQIQKYEDMYANKTGKALKGRFNVPLPILSGYVDTLKAKIDDAPRLNFERREEADTKVARKVSALWSRDSGDDFGQRAFVDLLVKGLAIFSGRGIYKIFSESDPEYRSFLEAKDYYDFYCEPQGGPDLERHLFLGEQNIFRSKRQLIEGAKSGLYDRNSVGHLLASESAADGLKTQQDSEQKDNRYRALNLTPSNNNFVGEDIYNLTEHYMVYNGKRYYLFFDEKSSNVIRAEELSALFFKDPFTGDALWPYVSFATHEDSFNFWSKGPCDDVYPVADSMRIIFNQTLDNIQKRNWGQRAFDREIFPDPSKLEYRPDGLADGTPPPGKSIREGIYTFETPDTTGITINLMGFVDNFMGQKSGITQGAQGASDKDKKVGIFFGEMEQVADRLGLTNKIYKNAWSQLGKRYLYGVRENLNEKTAVQVLGADGVEWDELDKNEVGDLNIKVSGGNDEARFAEVKSQRRIEAVDKILTNVNLSGKVNSDWAIEEILKTGGYEPDDIKRAVDVNNFADQDLMAEAAKAIQDIIKGKKPAVNRGATTGFIQKIIDFAYDKEVSDKVFDTLLAYADAHIVIAAENMARKAKDILMEKNMASAPAPAGGGAAISPSAPALNIATPANPAIPARVQNFAQRSAAKSQGIRP